MQRHQVVPFEARHGPTAVELLNSLYPVHFSTTVDRVLARVAALPTRPWVVTVEEHAVGYLEIHEPESERTPTTVKIGVWLSEDLDETTQDDLWQCVLLEVGRFEPIEFYTAPAMETWGAVRNFYQLRHFQEHFRSWGTWLDLAEVSVEVELAREADRLNGMGIRIHSLAKLGDHNTATKLPQLAEETSRDIPRARESSDGAASQEATTWVQMAGQNRDSCFIAVQGDRWVGFHLLEPIQGGNELSIEITGVARDLRRQGLGAALKLHGIDWAKRHGYRVLRTGMADTNQAIVALNDRIGFQREPAWIVFSRACG